MKNEEAETTEDAMQAVAEALRKARNHKLEVEVVTWSLKYMQENPALSITEAVELARKEWDV